MLIEFRLGNFLSFKEDQTLSMVPGVGKEHKATNILKTGQRQVPYLLRSAMMLGPNASGKTNLLHGLKVMRLMVRYSAREMGFRHNASPFMLGNQDDRGPSRFEVVFLEDGVRYRYGFTMDEQRICQEWLFSYPMGRQRRWFEREFRPGSGRYKWLFSDQIRGNKAIYREMTRPDSLFLSLAVTLNNQELLPIYRWFVQKLRIGDPFREITPVNTLENTRSETEKRAVLRFLRSAGIDLYDFREDERVIDELMGRQLPRESVFKVMEAFLCYGDSENLFEVNWEGDSYGVQKLFAMASMLLKVLKRDLILVIDDLNISLHSALLRELIASFHRPSLSNAQLIFTNHDLLMMDLKLFRRDQIWLVSRSEEQATLMTPLMAHHARKRESIINGYLSGRYGALPQIALHEHDYC